jgi:hypothetical protein
MINNTEQLKTNSRKFSHLHYKHLPKRLQKAYRDRVIDKEGFILLENGNLRQYQRHELQYSPANSIIIGGSSNGRR